MKKSTKNQGKIELYNTKYLILEFTIVFFYIFLQKIDKKLQKMTTF
jgi:hypothetical protein